MKKCLILFFLTITVSAFGQLEKILPLSFDGLYETDCYFEKGEDEGSQDYLRFYANGKVISIATDCDGVVSELKDWFNINAGHASIGTYEIKGRKIKFSTKSKTGVVNYKGRITNQQSLNLKWKSLINGSKGKLKYKFIKVSDLI